MSHGAEASPEAGPRTEPEVEHILAVRVGHGANCSSIGSVVDTLFATATVGAAVFAAVVVALKTEDVSRVSPPRSRRADPKGPARPEKES
jgi:hypothetical protein